MKDPQIFIVDDSKVQLILLEKMLKEAGYSVIAFGNGHKLIAALEENRPRLIISDIDMPKLSGFDLVQEVKKGQGESQIPFFLVSSHTESSIQEKALEVGADKFIPKPLQHELLIEEVKEKVVAA